MASRTTSLPRNANDTLLMPPEIFTPGSSCLMRPRGLDEVHGVVVVLLDARGHRQHVGIEDDVLRREPDLLGEQVVGAPADPHFVVDLDRLP